MLIDLDPRMKLIIVVTFIGSSYLLPNSYALSYMYVLITGLFLLRGLYKSAIRTVLTFAIFELLKYLVLFLPHESTVSALSYMLFFLQRTSTACVMISWMSAQLNISKLIASFYNMKLPASIIVSVAVIFRFFPTVKYEFSAIKNTMKLRMIGINAKNIFFHPIKTAEYSFIPLFNKRTRIAQKTLMLCICKIAI